MTPQRETMRLDHLDRCWASGYRSYEAKIPISQCPFAPRSEARKAWQEGWKQAKYEYEEAPPDE